MCKSSLPRNPVTPCSIISRQPQSRLEFAALKLRLKHECVKAYRWQEQLESGEYASIEDLAVANGVDRSYVGRILRLTSLAPEIVEVILDGDEPEGISLRRLQRELPLAWSDQM